MRNINKEGNNLPKNGKNEPRPRALLSQPASGRAGSRICCGPAGGSVCPYSRPFESLGAAPSCQIPASRTMEILSNSSSGPRTLSGSPRKPATGHGELPDTSEWYAQALDTQVGALQEGGITFCPANTHLTRFQDWRALGYFPLPK